VDELYTCCPDCGGDLVELPHGLYSVIECARACGWWDEKHPVTTNLFYSLTRDDSSGSEDRLGAALNWAEGQAPRCDICGELEQHKN
jgi:hypothetical protein